MAGARYGLLSHHNGMGGMADAAWMAGGVIQVHDDLDGVLRHLDQVRANDLYLLRPERLRPTG